jgi:hypothetical protein
MTLNRITSVLGAMALGGILVGSTHGAQAAKAAAPDPTRGGQHTQQTERTSHFQAPLPHPYGPNGMRMGMHCEDHDLS